MRKTTIKVTENINNGQVIKLEFVDGRKYKLQHPGNRKKLQWEKEYINPVSGIDQERFFDLCFEHCVIPEGHDFKPTVDNVQTADLEVWGSVLRRFLGGHLNEPIGERADTGGTCAGSESGSPE